MMSRSINYHRSVIKWKEKKVVYLMSHLCAVVKKERSPGNRETRRGTSVELNGGIYCNGVLVSIAIVQSSSKGLLVMS